MCSSQAGGIEGHQWSLHRTSGTRLPCRIVCDCGASTSWPCPAEPNGRAGTGAKVKYFDPTYDDGNGPVRFEYCPTGACP